MICLDQTPHFAQVGIALTGAGLGDGLRLVAVKSQRLLPEPEYVAGRLVEVTRRDEIVYGVAFHKPWVERQKCVRPEASAIVLASNL